jgi:hypothetical protein
MSRLFNLCVEQATVRSPRVGGLHIYGLLSLLYSLLNTTFTFKIEKRNKWQVSKKIQNFYKSVIA